MWSKSFSATWPHPRTATQRSSRCSLAECLSKKETLIFLTSLSIFSHHSSLIIWSKHSAPKHSYRQIIICLVWATFTILEKCFHVYNIEIMTRNGGIYKLFVSLCGGWSHSMVRIKADKNTFHPCSKMKPFRWPHPPAVLYGALPHQP